MQSTAKCLKLLLLGTTADPGVPAPPPDAGPGTEFSRTSTGANTGTEPGPRSGYAETITGTKPGSTPGLSRDQH